MTKGYSKIQLYKNGVSSSKQLIFFDTTRQLLSAHKNKHRIRQI